MARDYSYEPPTHRPPRLRRWLGAGAATAIVLALFIVGSRLLSLVAADRGAPAPVPVQVATAPAELPRDEGWAADPIAGARMPGAVQKVTTVGIKRGQTCAQALLGAGLASGDVAAALGALAKLVDFRRLRPGHELKVRQDQTGALVSLDLKRSPIDQVRAERAGDSFKAERLDVQVTTITAKVVGTIDGSLWDALASTGEDPRLAMDVADVFSWDIDFYSDVHPGDTFKILVEKRFAEGKLVEYGPITAAEFTTLGVVHRAFLYKSDKPDASPAYYSQNGESLRKQLLKAPLKYGHVTSGFGMRVHPVLGYSRAHTGMDYGVPPGTPVWSVGDGRVTRAGWYGGYGKYVEVRHANGWSSLYGHLSAINVRAGQHVSQKDTIGLSGSTGLSTGPHLHYGLMLNGVAVNPAKQRFERGKPLEGADKDTFKEEVKRLLEQMADGRVAFEAVPVGAEKG